MLAAEMLALFFHCSSFLSPSFTKVRDCGTAAATESEAALSGHTDFGNSVAFSSDNIRISCFKEYKKHAIVGLTTGSEAKCIVLGVSDYVRSVAFSPYSKHLASRSDDKTEVGFGALPLDQKQCPTRRFCQFLYLPSSAQKATSFLPAVMTNSGSDDKGDCGNLPRDPLETLRGHTQGGFVSEHRQRRKTFLA